MVKITGLLLIILLTLDAAESFEGTCLKCHNTQKIPSSLIYKRYLLKYSSKEKIRAVMVDYLKNPTAQKSIMPAPFITKFGLKKKIVLSDAMLEKYVDEFVKKYDVGKKLVFDTMIDN